MQSAPAYSSRKKLSSIQILRGLAAGAVVIAHTIEHPLSESPNGLVILGAFGVQVFFVISGFIIAYVNQDGLFNPLTFLVRRVFRIVPLYWLCTILVFFCALYLPSLFKTTVADTAYFLQSLFFIPASVPGDPHDWRPIYKLGWSLNYEMFFYIFFALFWWCKASLTRTVMMSGVLGLFVAGSFFIERDGSWYSVYMHTNLLTFIAGMWLAEAEKYGVWDRLSAGSVALLAVLAVPLLIATFSISLADYRYFSLYLVSLAAAALLVILALACERWTRNLQNNFFVQLGEISYSLYLTHMFVVGFGWFVINRLGLSGALQIAGMAGIVIACVIGAKISYHLVEMPSNKLGHLLTLRRRTPVPAS
ncbi:acyltransferase [Phyllobacterium sp. 628]|uniref:acyltransferase family protein n=1 Tax=Phyllobacterium sp. 628 TaxID=2718938 RepID=UPI00166277D0|nr:acyltransferase [Phyllobacterium sp. 628]QND52342.1 acyltransferase [Phyllobacterium sp. 628]